jgi:hypothetical protein
LTALVCCDKIPSGGCVIIDPADDGVMEGEEDDDDDGSCRLPGLLVVATDDGDIDDDDDGVVENSNVRASQMATTPFDPAAATKLCSSHSSNDALKSN